MLHCAPFQSTSAPTPSVPPSPRHPETFKLRHALCIKSHRQRSQRTIPCSSWRMLLEPRHSGACTVMSQCPLFIVVRALTVTVMIAAHPPLFFPTFPRHPEMSKLCLLCIKIHRHCSPRTVPCSGWRMPLKSRHSGARTVMSQCYLSIAVRALTFSMQHGFLPACIPPGSCSQLKVGWRSQRLLLRCCAGIGPVVHHLKLQRHYACCTLLQ